MVKGKKSDEHLRRQKAENASASGLEMSAQFNHLKLTFSFSEVFALKQVWEMTISAVLSAVVPLLIGTEQTLDIMFTL